MLRFDERQRAIFADKVLDVVNLVTAAVAIGFFIGEPRASGGLLFASLGVWTIALVFVLVISRKED